MSRLPLVLRSLRVQLALVGLVVQLLVAGAVVWVLFALTDRGMAQELSLRVAHSAPLLKASLIEPLIQRDYATVEQILSEVRDPNDFKYFVLLDVQNRVITSVGRPAEQALAPVDTDLNRIPWDRPDACMHLLLDISHAGQPLGQLRYAVSLQPYIDQRQQLLVASLWVALAGTVLGSVALTLAGVGLTRGLHQLRNASEAVERGQFSLRVSETGSHEFSRLAAAFNRMSGTLDDRFNALLDSQAQQAHYLALASSERARLVALLHALRLGVLLVDNDGRVLYTNAAFPVIWADQPVSMDDAPTLGEVRARIGQALGAVDDLPGALLSVPALNHQNSRHSLQMANGQRLAQSSLPVMDTDGNQLGRVWLFEDVTAEHEATELIHRMAARDSLTGLLNRHTFFLQLSDLMSAAHAKPLAVLFIDLDNFKLINDLNGHAAGDRVLIQIADSLTNTFRPGDLLARIGGDEFAVVMQDLPRTQLDTLCQRLQRNVAQIDARDEEGKLLRVGASIGVAWFPQDATDAHVLLAAADKAMYKAKSEGRGTWRQYEPGMNDQSATSEWMVWANRLSEALDHQLLRVYFQGVYHAQTRDLHHLEALVRMHNPLEPAHPYLPDSFIGHAENSGKILALDRWMISTCIRQLADVPGHAPIAVNISARTLVDARLPDFVGAELARMGVAPQRLLFELTETSAVNRIELAEQGVSQLQVLGCQVSLDDFGSGFTSIAYLKQLHADCVKIDGQFILRLAADEENQILLRAIVDIAHASGKQVVAEWIEDEATLALVNSFGVDLVQGYLFGQPVPMNEAA